MPAAGPPPRVAAPEVVSARVFPAPRDRVFQAFSDPAELARWWGPQGFTTELHEFDLRPGGRWRFVLTGPDGTRYEQDKTFVEVARPERVVLDHHQRGHDFRMTMTFDESPGGGTGVTSLRASNRLRVVPRVPRVPRDSFPTPSPVDRLLGPRRIIAVDAVGAEDGAEERGGAERTTRRSVARMRFGSESALAPVADAMRRGNEQNFDRLAAHLARRTAGGG